MNTHKLVPFVIGLGALSFFGLGCNPFASLQQKVEEKVGQSVAEGVLGAATKGQVDLNKNNVQFRDNKTGDFTAYGEDLKLPDDFPKDLQTPSGAKLIGVNLAGTKKTASVTFDTTGDVASVVSFYKNLLEKDGYKESQSLSANGMEIRAYEKSGLKISFTAAPKDGGGATTTVVREVQE